MLQRGQRWGIRVIRAIQKYFTTFKDETERKKKMRRERERVKEKRDREGGRRKRERQWSGSHLSSQLRLEHCESGHPWATE